MNIPAHTPATLTARVYRAPASMAPYHYYLMPGQAVRIHSTTDKEARCYCGEPGAPRIGEDYFTVPLSSLAFATPAAPDTATEEWEIWGEPGEKSLAIGPKSGGVAVCEIVTTNGEGRFSEETAARSIAIAKRILSTNQPAPSPTRQELLETVQRLSRMKLYSVDGAQGEIADDGEDAMRVLNFHIRAAREMLAHQVPTPEHEALAARDASLGVDHIWTATGCPAYRSYNPAECTCGKSTLPAFRAGAPVRVKVPAGHEQSAYNGERGHLVCQDGEMWQVTFPAHGITRAFYPDELTVLE